jgi:hypothetical protein
MPEMIACAGEGCACAVEREEAVRFGDRYYCSERCLDGRGCDHAGCNCGHFPTAEPPSFVHTPLSPHHYQH